MSVLRDQLRQTSVYFGFADPHDEPDLKRQPAGRTAGALAGSVAIKAVGFATFMRLVFDGSPGMSIGEGVAFGVLSTAVDEATQRARARRDRS